MNPATVVATNQRSTESIAIPSGSPHDGRNFKTEAEFHVPLPAGHDTIKADGIAANRLHAPGQRASIDRWRRCFLESKDHMQPCEFASIRIARHTVNMRATVFCHELSTALCHVLLSAANCVRPQVEVRYRIKSGDRMSKDSFRSMSDDELWRMFKDIAETLTERMAAEKQELSSRLEQLDNLLTVKRTDETASRQPYIN